MNMKAIRERFLHFTWITAFLMCLTFYCHYLYSWIGFNPTDDGFILAYSKRILRGEIPHRDFISIRPVGSAVVHLPFVLFGGGYCYWLSRMFVWFQFACVAILWTQIIDSTFKLNLRSFEKIFLSFVALVLSSHYFPIMAFHSIDGLFFVSIGMAMCVARPSWARFLGYLFIGCSYLCKQNFALIAPLSVILLNDWRKIRYWIAASLPGIMYVVSLGVVGALPNMIDQLSSHMSLWEHGVLRFTGNKNVGWSVAIGLIIMFLAFWQKRNSAGKAFAYLAVGKKLLAAVIIFILIFTTLDSIRKGNYLNPHSLRLFGVVLGVGLYALLGSHTLAKTASVSLLVALLGWSVAISLGYRYPALAGGPMGILLIAYLYLMIKLLRQPLFYRVALNVVMLITVLFSLYTFHQARHRIVYRDLESKYLTKPLGQVFPGGKMIKTSPRTYEFLKDLNLAIQKTNGKTFAILPYCAGYWVQADQANPLPIDWAQGTELAHVSVYKVFLDKLEALRGKIVLVVGKTQASTMSRGFKPIPIENDYYKVVRYVQEEFSMFDETKHFALYQ